MGEYCSCVRLQTNGSEHFFGTWVLCSPRKLPRPRFPWRTRAKKRQCSIQEFPGVRPIEAPDDNRLQKRGFKIPQVNAVTGAGR
jgi:hypothetical protein